MEKFLTGEHGAIVASVAVIGNTGIKSKSGKLENNKSSNSFRHGCPIF